jgi:hypothetical protein
VARHAGESESPDVSPRKGKDDHYHNHQAHFCPQVVGQAVVFVVDLHGTISPTQASPTVKFPSINQRQATRGAARDGLDGDVQRKRGCKRYERQSGPLLPSCCWP